jgi:uncharacterized protein YjiS (DUF1127 family)
VVASENTVSSSREGGPSDGQPHDNDGTRGSAPRPVSCQARRRASALAPAGSALADLGTLRADIPRFARERDPWQRLPGEAAFVLALGQLIERAEAWRARRREHARVYRELMAYSDRDLDELGIQRRDIRAISRPEVRAPLAGAATESEPPGLSSPGGRPPP